MADAKSFALPIQPESAVLHHVAMGQIGAPASMRRTLLALALGLGGLSLTALGDDAGIKSYGRHLAQECTGCHRLDGVDNGIPSILGWDAGRFIATLKYYRKAAWFPSKNNANGQRRKGGDQSSDFESRDTRSRSASRGDLFS